MGKQIMNGVTYGKPREILEVTQAQYDALSQAQKMNGTLYCIKDDGMVEGEKFAPVIYSFGEREIGTWVDGKPLYQKTISCGELPSNSGTFTKTIPHNINNIDYVASIAGVAHSTVNGYTLPLEDIDANAGISGAIRIFANASNVYITTYRSQSEYDESFITIRYTKTTDVPGSGEWTSTGVPAVHYSTDEQVIGTWIDGKPIYQKTFNNLSWRVNSGGVTLPSNVNNDISDAETIIFSVAQRTETNGIANIPLYIWEAGNNNYMALSADSWGDVSTITLQYTKTTD